MEFIIVMWYLCIFNIFQQLLPITTYNYYGTLYTLSSLMSKMYRKQINFSNLRYKQFISKKFPSENNFQIFVRILSNSNVKHK